MINAPSNPDHPKAKNEVANMMMQRLAKFGLLYVRLALGAAFLSAVADRFGFWGKYGAWGNFANFEQYTAQVNSFMPAFAIPFLAWAATAAELSLGIGLILGVWRRWVALGAAGLLFLFGYCYGHFFWHQVSLGLLGIFRFRRRTPTFPPSVRPSTQRRESLSDQMLNNNLQLRAFSATARGFSAKRTSLSIWRVLIRRIGRTKGKPHFGGQTWQRSTHATKKVSFFSGSGL
jgi:uncharacterized membrane protein YphA (DoxX/SURF4 family)